MHIVIGFIVALSGLIFALARLQSVGFDLHSLNPFLAYKRYQWKKKYSTKPLFTLTNPLDVAALLILATAKCEGELSAEQKEKIERIFQDDFKLSKSESSALMVSSSFLLRDEMSIVGVLDKILQNSKPKFTEEQINSLVLLMGEVAHFSGEPNEEQQKLIGAVLDHLLPTADQQTVWG